MKQWKVLQTIKEIKNAQDIIKILLKNRHLTTKKQIDEFLHPPQPYTLNPSSLGISMRELSLAIKRVKQAINSGEEIIVYGDYDADGVCGTAILWETLDKLGANSLPYIPKRLEEGYGLSIQGIQNIKHQTPARQSPDDSRRLAGGSNIKLIITVDNGISAAKAINYAKKNGIDVIITDHHLPPKKLPKAFAIVHTTKLSGAGVAWFLAKELARHPRGVPQAQHHRGGENGLELAAIGTIADVVPLVGPNRSLTKYGLNELNKTKRLGLLSLFEEAGLEKGKIETWTVNYIITPRLNATGRLTDAIDSLRLVCTRDSIRAKKLAKKLGEENRRRQQLNSKAFLNAKAHFVPPHPKLLFIASESYHEGVIGLVAGDLVREFYRPAIVISLGDKFSKGSARSIEGFNIIQAIRKCEKFLIDCGGHPMAAGLSIKTDNLDKFKKCIMKVAEKELKEEDFTQALPIDCKLRLSDLTWRLYEGIEKFAPFGMANPEPVFCTCGLRIVGMRAVGSNGNHLKLRLDDPRTKKVEEVLAFEEPLVFDGIGFGMGEFARRIKNGDLVDIAYTLQKNVWNDEERLELKIKDIKRV